MVFLIQIKKSQKTLLVTEKDKYQDTDIYNNTVSIINDGLKDSIQIKPGSGNNARRINVSDK